MLTLVLLNLISTSACDDAKHTWGEFVVQSRAGETRIAYEKDYRPGVDGALHLLGVSPTDDVNHGMWGEVFVPTPACTRSLTTQRMQGHASPTGAPTPLVKDL